MKITKQWLTKHGACEEGIIFYEEQNTTSSIELFKACDLYDRTIYAQWLLSKIQEEKYSNICTRFLGIKSNPKSRLKNELRAAATQALTQEGYIYHVLLSLLLREESPHVQDRFVALLLQELHHLNTPIPYLTLQEVKDKHAYWRTMFLNAEYETEMEAVSRLLLRIGTPEHTPPDRLTHLANEIHRTTGNERFSYKSQLELLLKCT